MKDGGFFHFFHSSVFRNAKNDESLIMQGFYSGFITCRIGCLYYDSITAFVINWNPRVPYQQVQVPSGAIGNSRCFSDWSRDSVSLDGASNRLNCRIDSVLFLTAFPKQFIFNLLHQIIYFMSFCLLISKQPFSLGTSMSVSMEGNIENASLPISITPWTTSCSYGSAGKTRSSSSKGQLDPTASSPLSSTHQKRHHCSDSQNLALPKGCMDLAANKVTGMGRWVVWWREEMIWSWRVEA
ncbi:unnamed protein product, partial [Vitis vinifera]